jgi:predicted Zn-dependent protease
MNSIDRFRAMDVGRTKAPKSRRWGLWFATALAATAMTLGEPQAASAQGTIRDAEIEATIRDFTTPLLRAAGLNPEAVDIYIRKDDSLNAFVAGGQNLFLNTGFLLETKGPLEVIGVLAHETGHIAGGHLARTSDAISGASNTALVATLLGVVVAAASGNAGAGSAIALGGGSIAQRSFLTYSRNQESAADQAALRYLDQTGQSASGLAEFLGTLEGQQLLSSGSRSPYLSTHPLTNERINTVRSHLEKSRFADRKPTPEQQARYDRMIAKLHGFLRSPSRTFKRYPDSDTSVPARYARAIAYYEIPDLPSALREVDGLLAEYPDDPFFHELRGQILFENGQVAAAEPSYRRAHELLPDNGQLTFQYARLLLAFNDPRADTEALRLLKTSAKGEDVWPAYWRQLAIAHGRLGELADSALALAEEAVRTQQWQNASDQARRAQAQVAPGSPLHLRAVDIEEQAKREIERARK